MLMDCVCGTAIEAKLDLSKGKNGEVVCTNCWEIIEVTQFTKNSMKSRNDIVDRKKLEIPPNGIQMTCDNPRCNLPFSAEVDKKKDAIKCPHCKTLAKASSITVEMLKSNGVFEGYTKKYFEKEVDTDPIKEQIEAEGIRSAKEQKIATEEAQKAVKERQKEAEMLEGKTTEEDQPKTVKRGRGRPKGSKNKKNKAE